jgi:hypothetical protein
MVAANIQIFSPTSFDFWFWWAIFPLAIFFGAGAILGAPFLPVRRAEAESAIKLAGIKPGQTIIDLGSGDGAFLVVAARMGIKAIGYEINPYLAFWSRIRTWRYRKLVRIHVGNYWNAKLPPADAIYVFIMKHYIPKLERKLLGELPASTKIISYIFDLPGMELVQKNHNTYIYRNSPKP